MPYTFTVSMVMDGLELDDVALDRLFSALPDAVPTLVGGVATVASPVVARTAADAAFRLVELLGEIFPQSAPVRLDQDLVSIPDIAARSGRSRESVRLLIEGKRGPGGFPPPVGIVGDGIRVWPWAAVVRWFREQMGEHGDEVPIPPEAAAVVDACLAARRAPYAHQASFTWTGRSSTGGRPAARPDARPYRMRTTSALVA